MLFDHDQLPRHRVDELPDHKREFYERHGASKEDQKTVARKGTRRKRYGAIKHGKLTLIRLDIVKVKKGPLKGQIEVKEWKNGGRSVSVKCLIAEGQQENRWFFDRFVLKGYPPEVKRTRECLSGGLSCYSRSMMGDIDDREVTIDEIRQLDGMIVPVMILQEEHYQTGEMKNRFHPLRPDPEHEDHDGYHELVSRCMKIDEKFDGDKTLGGFIAEVPGWDIFEDSKTYRLVKKRIRDATEGMSVTGLTRLEARRMRNTAKAVERFSKGLD